MIQKHSNNAASNGSKIVDDVFWIIVGNALCFWMGVRWGHHRTVMRIIRALAKNPQLFDRAVNEYQRELAIEVDVQKREITVEQHGEQYYAFEAATKEFLAQAPTESLVRELAQDRLAKKI